MQIVLIITGGIGGVVALVVAYRKQRIAEDAHRWADETNLREATKLFNERFTAASAQLGHESAAVRLAGVYAIAGLADDWRTGRQTCVDVLCAYLRMPYQPDPEAATAPAWKEGEQQVRWSIMSIIRDHLQDHTDRPEQQARTWQGLNLNFTGAHFDGGNFNGAHFDGGTVRFGEATFSGGAVGFTGATFSGGTVGFTGATFSGGTVWFDGATFSGCEVGFSKAEFSGGAVLFGGAKFSGSTVWFHEAKFSGSTVWFDGAEFSGGDVNFSEAEFSGGKVKFSGAKFSGGKVKFSGAKFSGGEVWFDGAKFSGGEVWFDGAKFSGGTVKFDSATFSGSMIDFTRASGEHPLAFDARATLVPGLLLPTYDAAVEQGDRDDSPSSVESQQDG
ncbi:pentapeptide repeat-containing protein [Catellatospora sichuanensis]|uniref:pentapeptide repeat-containing protein n=1 Tax=Catellatospora sichuanensis TaxID=1969805 RepID=UPI0016425B2C|nr:pentapeptide repeat-containing protein [Catellatospora sichuanensis]